MNNQIQAEVNADQTVTITFQGESRNFDFIHIQDFIHVAGVFAGRFRSGKKLWPLSVTIWKSGNVCVNNGGFSNKGGVTSICGFWNPESNANTKHNGTR